jgi:hypothetical protein
VASCEIADVRRQASLLCIIAALTDHNTNTNINTNNCSSNTTNNNNNGNSNKLEYASALRDLANQLSSQANTLWCASDVLVLAGEAELQACLALPPHLRKLEHVQAQEDIFRAISTAALMHDDTRVVRLLDDVMSLHKVHEFEMQPVLRVLIEMVEATMRTDWDWFSTKNKQRLLRLFAMENNNTTSTNTTRRDTMLALYDELHRRCLPAL